MAAAAILKITKIAVFPRWCKLPIFTKFGTVMQMGFLTSPTVKTFEFQKSKMAHGRHFENC